MELKVDAKTASAIQGLIIRLLGLNKLANHKFKKMEPDEFVNFLIERLLAKS